MMYFMTCFMTYPKMYSMTYSMMGNRDHPYSAQFGGCRFYRGSWIRPSAIPAKSGSKSESTPTRLSSPRKIQNHPTTLIVSRLTFGFWNWNFDFPTFWVDIKNLVVLLNSMAKIIIYNPILTTIRPLLSRLAKLSEQFSSIFTIRRWIWLKF